VIEGGLKEARKAASQAINKSKLGEDVAAAKKAALCRRITFGDLVPKYLDARKPTRAVAAAGDDDKRRRKILKARTWEECKRYLEHKNYWQPLHRLPVDAIGVTEIVTELNRIEKDHGASTADAAKRYVSGFFAWALERLQVKTNPALGIRGRAGTTGRKRVLSEAELAEVWRACGEDDYGRIVRLLILTGQRRSEIADLPWAEINATEAQIELPPERTKNHLPHILCHYRVRPRPCSPGRHAGRIASTSSARAHCAVFRDGARPRTSLTSVSPRHGRRPATRSPCRIGRCTISAAASSPSRM
jgi:integrase